MRLRTLKFKKNNNYITKKLEYLEILYPLSGAMWTWGLQICVKVSHFWHHEIFSFPSVYTQGNTNELKIYLQILQKLAHI